MNSIQFNLARVIGPVLGGWALTQLGAAWCFGLNGISYVAVVISLLAIHVPFTPNVRNETVLVSMKQGFDFIRRRQGMLPMIAVAFVCTFLGIPILVFLPVFAKDIYHGDEKTYTILLAIEAAGAITGALLVAAWGKRSSLGRDALLGLTLLGVFESAFAFSPNILFAYVSLFFGGMALIGCFALLSSLVQHMASDEMRGRVMSLYNIAFRGGMPIGSLVTGALIPSFGAPLIVGVYGILLACLALYLLVFHRRFATV
jgi:predicted MFS family arabinose efflux permease